MDQMKLTQLSASTLIDASREEVWDVVKKVGSISDYHPLVKSSKSTNYLKGIGARRHCDLLPMGSMDEEITAWQEGTSLTADVIGGKMLPPCHQMKGKLELVDAGNRTRVTFTFTYQMKLGLMGKMLNTMMIKPLFKKAPLQYVQGLKDYIESMESNLR